MNRNDLPEGLKGYQPRPEYTVEEEAKARELCSAHGTNPDAIYQGVPPGSDLYEKVPDSGRAWELFIPEARELLKGGKGGEG
jgi:hypothetical protein